MNKILLLLNSKYFKLIYNYIKRLVFAREDLIEGDFWYVTIPEAPSSVLIVCIFHVTSKTIVFDSREGRRYKISDIELIEKVNK